MLRIVARRFASRVPIYTRTGDQGMQRNVIVPAGRTGFTWSFLRLVGTSSLLGGVRQPKTSAVFDALGAADELSCHIGSVQLKLHISDTVTYLELTVIRLSLTSYMTEQPWLTASRPACTQSMRSFCRWGRTGWKILSLFRRSTVQPCFPLPDSVYAARAEFQFGYSPRERAQKHCW